MNSNGGWVRLFRESFIPVVMVILGIFLVLLYVRFRAEYDANTVTVIKIQSNIAAEVDEGKLPPVDIAPPIISGTSDLDLQRAAALVERRKWREAEQLYLQVLSRQPNSRVLNYLGVLNLKKGDMKAALDYFNRAIVDNPADTSALFNRALAFSRSGQDAQAIDGYRELLTRQPAHFEAQYNLGILLINRGDNSAGTVELEKAVKLGGGKRKARALYSLGTTQRKLGHTEQAAKSFEMAIRLSPSDPELRLGLAALEPGTTKGQASALAQYRKILELAPNYSPALVNMAAILNAQRKRREAEQMLRQAIQSDPEFIRAHTALGSLLLDDKRWSDARSEFEWVIQRDPKREEARFNLGRVAYGEKDFDKAIAEYKTALQIASGKYPEAHFNLGLTYSAKNDYAAALAAYQAALETRHDYPEAWHNIGITYLRLKDSKNAESAFNNALRQRPDYEQAWFNLAVIYGNTERDAAAIEAYRKALSIRPGYRAAQLNLAVRHAKREEYDEAIRLYRAILANDDTYSLAWFDLGFAYIEKRQYADAVTALRRAAALDPSNTKTLRFLGRALLLNKQGVESAQILESAVTADPSDARLRLEFTRALREAGRVEDARNELAKARQLDPVLTGLDEEASKLKGR